MGNKKTKLGKPASTTSGMNFKVRFKQESNGGHFVITNTKGKVVDAVKYKNHDLAFTEAKRLQELTFKK